MVDSAPKTLAELEVLTEAELEAVIKKGGANVDDARYTLGKLYLEGTFPEAVPRNEQKGLNWLQIAYKNGHLPAIEFKTYHTIRFGKVPDLSKIESNLEKVINEANSSRACNTLAEFAHAQNKVEGYKEKAAKYYMQSADLGCLIGTHWIGVFYQEGFGVTKNLDKSIELLNKAAKMGNAQSNFQLFLLYSREEEKKDVKLAYKNLSKAVQLGVTYFDQLNEFFKDNYDVLAPIFLEQKKPPAEINFETKQEVLNLHDAFLHDVRTSFMDALAKDRMYHRPCGFVTDQQIWMLGVLLKYLLKKVIHFSHADFLTAMRVDLGPLLGDTGLWLLKNYIQKQTERGNNDKKKQARAVQELIKSYLENGFDYIGQEKKYNLINRFGPKKFPDQQIKRSDIPLLYSWIHYAPMPWFESTFKLEKSVKQATDSRGNTANFQLCSYCGTPESETIKHKRCSACRQRLYCSPDCQKYDWKKSHKTECKSLKAKAAKQTM